jgi:hypothetical protein
MPSTTISPSLDQGAKLQFEDNFRELAQQKQSKLESSAAVVHLSSNGKTANMGRIGRLELEEVNSRNPDKSYGDYALDNRQLTKRRFTRTITIDKKYDINELIKDPTSDILKQLVNAKNRVVDRVLAAAAVGNVLTGAPDASPTTTSAATDGVVTISAVNGVTYAVIQQITQKFINNELDYSEFTGALLCITGKENTDLMQEPQFINNDYISARVVDAGKVDNAGVYRTVLFAGSENGGITVSSPILPEGASTRTCMVLAPGAVALSMEIGDMGVEKNSNKVNSMDLTIDLWINAMRIEGARVIALTTTM